jgi:hypothetical protein
MRSDESEGRSRSSVGEPAAEQLGRRVMVLEPAAIPQNAVEHEGSSGSTFNGVDVLPSSQPPCVESDHVLPDCAVGHC